MANAIEKGLDFLKSNFGIKPVDVQVVQNGNYLYCLLDTVTKTFTLPFISTSDEAAKKQLYDVVTEQTNSNLYKYQKTFTLWRVCCMDFNKDFKKCAQPICYIDALIDFFDELYKKGKYSVSQKELELPQFSEFKGVAPDEKN